MCGGTARIFKVCLHVYGLCVIFIRFLLICLVHPRVEEPPPLYISTDSYGPPTHWSYIINDTCRLSPSPNVTGKKSPLRHVTYFHDYSGRTVCLRPPIPIYIPLDDTKPLVQASTCCGFLNFPQGAAPSFLRRLSFPLISSLFLPFSVFQRIAPSQLI